MAFASRKTIPMNRRCILFLLNLGHPRTRDEQKPFCVRTKRWQSLTGAQLFLRRIIHMIIRAGRATAKNIKS